MRVGIPIAAATASISGVRLPPGPIAGRLAQAAAFHRDPLGFLRSAREEFGDVFTLRLAVAGPMVVFADPQVIDEVVTIPRDAGHAGAARRRIVQMISERSILGADGDGHRAARSRLTPAFTPEQMHSRREAMTRIADEHVAGWPGGRPFRVLPRMRAIADEIFARLVLGVRDHERASALAAATQRMLWTPGNPPFPPPGEQAGLLGAAAKRLFERRKAPAAALLGAEIEARRAAGGDGQVDVLGAMLDAAPEQPTEELVDQLLPLLMAGQEPPAAGLTWVLDRLARSPDLAERFRHAPDDDPLRAATVREALRLRPAVHSVARLLTEPRVIGGHELPAGAVANVPIVLVHRDPDAFPDPDAFRPERFVDRDTDDLPFLPFGGGPRRCLGEWLAHAQIDTVIPAVLRRRALRPLLADTERMVVRGTVLVPHRSGLARA